MSLLTTPLLLLYLCLGLLSGLSGGLLGLGGGVVLVPALLLVFLSLDFPGEYLMHIAVTTSLATIVFTASVATLTHHRARHLDWLLVARLTPGIIAGAVVGAFLASNISSEYLRRLFGLFELMVAAQIGFGLIPPAAKGLPRAYLVVPASAGIGFLSTLMGIGGGSLSTPFLVFCQVNLKRAIAVSSACGLPIALTGVVSMVVLSHDVPGLPPGTYGYLYWPAVICIVTGSVAGAWVGARLLHRIQLKLLRCIFAAFLAVIGCGMII